MKLIKINIKTLVNSIKKKKILKTAEEQIVRGIVLATTTCHTLLLGLEMKVLCCLELLLLESMFLKSKFCLFEQDVSGSLFMSI